jgi:hypothetical protein
MLQSQELNPEQQAEAVLSFARRLIAQNDLRLAIPVLEKLVEYFPETVAARQARALRDSLVAAPTPPPGLDQNGRVSVVVFSTLYGTWLGVAIPVIANADDPKTFVASMMAGSAAGLVISLNATENAAISDGRASLINFGGWFGTWQGIAWGNAIGVDTGEDIVAGSVIGGLTGMTAAILLTNNKEIRRGYATTVNFGGIWGSWFALCGAMIADVQESETAWGIVGTGGVAGVATTAIAARNTRMSRGRARLINIAGVVGTVFGLGIAVLAEVDDDPAIFAIMGAGSVAGLLAGRSATKNYDSTLRLDDDQRFGLLGLPYRQVIKETKWTPPVRMVKVPLVSFNF